MISLKINKLKKGLVPSTIDHKSDSKKIEEGVNNNTASIEDTDKVLKVFREEVGNSLKGIDIALSKQSQIDDDFRGMINNLKNDYSRLNNIINVLETKIINFEDEISNIVPCQCKPRVGFFRKIWNALVKFFS